MDALFRIGFLVSLVDRASGPLGALTARMRAFTAWSHKLVAATNRIAAFSRKIMAMSLLMLTPLMLAGKAYGDFEQKSLQFQTVIQSTMGGVGKSLEFAQQRARDFSRQHVQSASQFMETAYMMGSAGLKDRAAVEATATAMKVATATMGDHVDAANMLAVIYNNMGDKLADPRREMQRLGDIVTATQQTFQFENLGAVTEGFKYAASSALEMRWPLEELMTTIGQLNNVGLQGGMAGTALQNSLAHILPASKKLGFQVARDAQGNLQYIETLENISRALGPVKQWTDETAYAVQQAFGIRGKRAITTLLPHLDALRANFEKIKGSAGVTDETVKLLESGLIPQVVILKNKIKDVALTLGNMNLKDTVIELQLFVDRVGAFAEMSPGLARSIMDFAGGLFMVGAGGLVAAKVFKVLLWSAGLLAVPIGAVVNWLAGWIVSLGGALIGAEAFGAAVASVAGLLAAALAVFVLAGAAIWSAVKYWDRWLLVLEKIHPALAGLWAPFESLIKGFTELMGRPPTIMETVFLIIEEIGARIHKKISELLSDAWQWGVDLIKTFVEGLKSGSLSDLFPHLSQMLEKVREFFHRSEPRRGPLRGMSKSGAAMMEAFGQGARDGAKSLSARMAASLSPFAPSKPAAAPGGSKTVRVDKIEINLNGSGGSQIDAAAIRREVYAAIAEAAEAI